jgi:mannose-6-phosphate isomerase-like protein (cupin superfamily)
MTEHNESNQPAPPRVRVLGPDDGEIAGEPGVLHDRFMVRSEDSGGSFALVEHLIPPGVLAAPLHRHSREDEYSYVLEGRVGAVFGGEEVYANAGEFVFKPRGEWHTFWNAGDVPLRILEIISPGGFEEAFREMGALGDALTPERMAEIAAQYGVDADFDGTGPIMERHGLSM